MNKPAEVAEISEATFNDYARFIEALLTGRQIRRTTNAAVVEYALERIAGDNPGLPLAVALATLDEHIAYLELTYGGIRHNFRGLSARYRDRIDKIPIDGLTPLYFPPNEDSVEIERSQGQDDFQDRIARAINDPASARRARLENANVITTTRAITVDVYIRNPDVVAEALFLANGKCGRCSREAPFRRMDGRLYLEVHHRVPLAEGGDDSVDNAVALCPNCHREAHFGENWLDFRS